MDGHGDHGLRILGVLAGIGATLPVGFLALVAIQARPIGYFAGQPIRLPFEAGVVLGGITLALLIATVAIADGEAWGALVLALYGAGRALLIYCTARTEPYATGSDAGVVAFHVAVGVLMLTVAYGLTRDRSGRGARSNGRP
jgi:hypothetical protein